MIPHDMSQYEKYIIDESATLHDSLGKITANNRGSVVVRGSSGELLGVLSDGDVRRALLAGATLFTPVIKFANPNPIFLTEEEATGEKIQAMFAELNHIQIIPIVRNNILIKVEVRNT